MAFIAGLFVGAMIGVFVMCLMFAAKCGDCQISTYPIKTGGE